MMAINTNTTSSSTSSQGRAQELPPLAQYRAIKDYYPAYGDYIVWSGILTTWHGIVTNYDKNTNELYVIFSGLPILLFTMDGVEQIKETKKITLSKLTGSAPGKFSAMQHDFKNNAIIWYI